MACFLVPGGEAIVATALTCALTAREKKQKASAAVSSGHELEDKREKNPFVSKLKWLTNLLWGGCFLLCFEHIWHGEVVPFFPFLTAATDPEEFAVMLSEMRSVGGTMALAITAVWLAMVLISHMLENKAQTVSAEN